MPPKKRVARAAASWASGRISQSQFQSPYPFPSPSTSSATSSVRMRSMGTQTETQRSGPASRAPARPKRVTSKVQLSIIRRGVRRASEWTHHHPAVHKDRCITARPGVAGDIPPPLANEKACQTTRSWNPVLLGVLNIPELTVEEMRQQRIHNTQVERLKHLLDIVNADVPPPWNLSSGMWREINQLEDSIKAYHEQLSK